MPRTPTYLIVAILALAAADAAAQTRYGFAPDQPLEVRSAPGDGAILLTLPAHSLYFAVLELTPEEGGWARIESLPSVAPPYRGWVPRAAVEVFDSVLDARLRYFATHPLRAEVERFAAVLHGGYWDLRDQSVEAASYPALWLRYGFDFAEWYIVRGKTYEAEARDVADIQSVSERLLVLTVFTAMVTTPPERVEIEILRADQIRLRQVGLPAFRFSRSPPPVP